LIAKALFANLVRMNHVKETIWSRGQAFARQSIRETVKTRYFPEIWYATQHWLALAKGRRVLEAGYGIGLVAEALAKSGWSVTTTDVSLTALAELKTRFEKSGLTGAFEQGKLDKLPFANASFDAVVSINTLEFAFSQLEAVREIARVLAPGGHALIATFNRRSPWGIPAVARAIRRDGGRRDVHFINRLELTALLRAPGLVVEDVKERAQYLPFATRSLKLGLPVPGAFAAFVVKPALKAVIRPEKNQAVGEKK